MLSKLKSMVSGKREEGPGSLRDLEKDVAQCGFYSANRFDISLVFKDNPSYEAWGLASFCFHSSEAILRMVRSHVEKIALLETKGKDVRRPLSRRVYRFQAQNILKRKEINSQRESGVNRREMRWCRHRGWSNDKGLDRDRNGEINTKNKYGTKKVKCYLPGG